MRTDCSGSQREMPPNCLVWPESGCCRFATASDRRPWGGRAPSALAAIEESLELGFVARDGRKHGKEAHCVRGNMLRYATFSRFSQAVFRAVFLDVTYDSVTPELISRAALRPLQILGEESHFA